MAPPFALRTNVKPHILDIHVLQSGLLASTPLLSAHPASRPPPPGCLLDRLKASSLLSSSTMASSIAGQVGQTRPGRLGKAREARVLFGHACQGSVAPQSGSEQEEARQEPEWPGGRGRGASPSTTTIKPA